MYFQVHIVVTNRRSNTNCYFKDRRL